MPEDQPFSHDVSSRSITYPRPGHRLVAAPTLTKMSQLFRSDTNSKTTATTHIQPSAALSDPPPKSAPAINDSNVAESAQGESEDELGWSQRSRPTPTSRNKAWRYHGKTKHTGADELWADR